MYDISLSPGDHIEAETREDRRQILERESFGKVLGRVEHGAFSKDVSTSDGHQQQAARKDEGEHSE